MCMSVPLHGVVWATEFGSGVGLDFARTLCNVMQSLAIVGFGIAWELRLYGALPDRKSVV